MMWLSLVLRMSSSIMLNPASIADWNASIVLSGLLLHLPMWLTLLFMFGISELVGMVIFFVFQ